MVAEVVRVFRLLVASLVTLKWCSFSLVLQFMYLMWIFCLTVFFGKFVSIAATLFRIVCFHILFSSCMVFLSSFT